MMKSRPLPTAAVVFVLSFLGFYLASEARGNAAAETRQPLPADFPAIEKTTTRTFSGTPMDSEFKKLEYINFDLLKSLSRYTPDSIAREFERRMEKEPDFPAKLLLAEIAAEHGSQAGRQFIEQLAGTDDYQQTISRLDAIDRLLRIEPPADWAIDAALAALRDERQMTHIPNWISSRPNDIATHARDAGFLHSFGLCKSPRSVPFLIEMVQKDPRVSGEALRALGMIGDPRAIPACLTALRKEDQRIREMKDPKAAPPAELLSALGDFKVKAAVETLLPYIHSPDVIVALGKIGDKRAVAPLQRLVADKGKVKPEADPERYGETERWYKARAALVRLSKDDTVPQWLRLLQDDSLAPFQRAEAAYELELHPDPRTRKPLLALIKSNPPRLVCRGAIAALAQQRSKETVSGLIACFDIPLTVSKDIWDSNPYEELASALHTLTGQDFGPDKARWEMWWSEGGKNLPALQ